MKSLQSYLAICSMIFSWSASVTSIPHTDSLSRRTDGAACRLPAVNGIDLTEGFGDATYQKENGCATSVGTLNAFMFFIDFPDAPANETAQSSYDVFFPQAPEWYFNTSYGRLVLNVTADTSKFYRMASRSTSYNWQRSLTSEMHHKYIQDALDAYSRYGGEPIPPVEVLYIVVTDKAAAISFSVTYMGEVTFRNGTHVSEKCTTIGVDAFATWKFKVINHETGHCMCLPDLYPTNGGSTEMWVGGWDMMGWILGPSPEYFAWHKWKLGWIDDSQVDCITSSGSTTHTLTPLETVGGANDTKAVVIKKNSTTALVAEGRFKLAEDSNACETGVLLYTVSTDTNTGDGPIRVIDTNPNSGGCDGDEKNDAALNMNKTSSYAVLGWGVKVTLTSQNDTAYVIEVDVS